MGAPESDMSEREVPIPEPVVSVLRKHKLACPKGKLGLVFPTGTSTVENHSNIYNRGWRAAQTAAGVVKKSGTPKYGFHAARHYYASLIIAQKFTPKRCQVARPLFDHDDVMTRVKDFRRFPADPRTTPVGLSRG